MGWGQWEVCLISLGQDGAVSAAGPVERIKIKQCDIMLGAHHRSLNLRQGCGALLTLALGTGAGDTVGKTLPCCPGILLMQQQGGCFPSPASSSLRDTPPWALGL